MDDKSLSRLSDAIGKRIELENQLKDAMIRRFKEIKFDMATNAYRIDDKGEPHEVTIEDLQRFRDRIAEAASHLNDEPPFRLNEDLAKLISSQLGGRRNSRRSRRKRR
jgi:hypothetical protein